MPNENNGEYYERNKELVLEAFKSMSLDDFGGDWEKLTRALTKRALTLRRITGPMSIEMKTLDALRIYGKVNSLEFEESSQRWVAKFTENKDGAEEEMLRSPRMDSFDGRVIEPFIKQLKEKLDAGEDARATFYKYNEMPSDSRKSQGGNVPSKGYRVFCWLDVR